MPGWRLNSKLHMNEITLEELRKWPKDSYELIDIRDDVLVAYGMIPGALHIPVEAIEEGKSTELENINRDKKLVLYCQIGRRSKELERSESLEGWDIYSLEGGYLGYVRAGMLDETAREEKQQKAEESIRKKFHKQLFTPFAKACKTYQLISEGDHIAVCISGGKDSMLLALCMARLQRFSRFPFTVRNIVMDPGYAPENLRQIVKD